MYKKLLLIASLFLLFIGCNPEENEQSNLPEDTVEEVDTTAPIPSITGLEVDLEVTTTINISIQETSTIEEISVLVNQSEILNTKEKVFSFELNPFDYPNGENTLSIVAKDSEGNQSEENQTFEVNKLLVSIAAPAVPAVSQLFFSVNTMDGDLVAFAPVTRPLEIVKLYADDDFTPQPIIVTSYEMQPEAVYKASLKSIGGIEPGTDLLKLQEAAGFKSENTIDTSPYLEGGIVLNVTDINNEKLANSLFGAGYNHSAISRNTNGQSDNYEAQIFFRFQESQSVNNAFIYPSSFFIPNDEQQISIEEYKYLFIENPSNSTYSIQDFKVADTEFINIPSSVTSSFLRTFGFLNNEAFKNNDYRYVYDLNIENTNNLLELPLIKEFEFLRNSLILNLNDRRRLEISTLGFKDVVLPEWTVMRSDNTINMTGEFDKFTLSFILGDNPDVSMAWDFTDKYQESFEMPFESFEFPEEFITYSSAQNLSLLDFNSRGIFYIEQFDSSEPWVYEELLFNIFTYTKLGDVYILRTDL